jgi:hypothetical protein
MLAVNRILSRGAEERQGCVSHYCSKAKRYIYELATALFLYLWPGHLNISPPYYSDKGLSSSFEFEVFTAKKSSALKIKAVRFF